MAGDKNKQGLTGTARFDTSDQQVVGESEYGGVGGNVIPERKGGRAASRRPGYEEAIAAVQSNPAEGEV